MRASLEGMEEDAEQEAAAVGEAAAQRQPPDEAAQMDVTQLDRIADKIWDVLAQWERCRQGRGDRGSNRPAAATQVAA